MQRWIVAALGILVVAVAVFLLTERGGDRTASQEEAPAVAGAQDASAPTAGDDGAPQPQSAPAEETHAAAADGGEVAEDRAGTERTEADRADREAADGEAAEATAVETEEAEGEGSAATASQAPAAAADRQAGGGEGEAREEAADAGAAQAPPPEALESAAAEAEPPDGVSVAIEDQANEAEPPAPAADSGAAEAQGREAQGEGAQIAALPDSREVSESVRPSFDIVRIEGNGDAVLAGRAEPGSDVTLYAGDADLASVVADGNGNWVLLPDRPLPAGSHELTLRSRSPDGVEIESADAVIVVVPDAPRDVAQATGEPADSGQTATGQTTTGQTNGGVGRSETVQTETGASETFGQRQDGQQDGGQQEGTGAATDALAVLVPREGAGASQVLQRPEGEGIQDDQLVLLAVDYDAGGRIVISGRAAPGARVIAYLDDKAVGQGQANDSGRWVISPGGTVSPGLHRLRIDQVDASGQVVARVETPFSRAEMLTSLPDERFVIVQPGNSLWRIARRTYGSGFRYTVIYRSNAEQIRDPDLIYPGQVFMLPQDAGGVN